MKENLFKLVKHTAVYFIGIVISKITSFIMLPIYTRYLTPADYGIMELLSMTLDIIAMIGGLGITSAIFKYYSAYESQEEKKQVISTAAFLMGSVSFVFALAGLFYSRSISLLVFSTAENTYYFRLYFIIYFLQIGAGIIPLAFIRALQKSRLFIQVNLLRLLAQVSFNIYFVVINKMGIKGILYSTLLVELGAGIFLSAYMFRNVGFRFSWPKTRQMTTFGYPFVLASISSFVITFSDRYFLNAYRNLDDVGIYSLAYKFGFLLGFLAVGPFMQIWEPERFEIAKQKDPLPVFKKVFFYFNVFLISLSLLISLFVKDVLTVMSNPAYHAAYKIVPIIILAYILQAWTFYCNIGIYLKERSKHMALASILSAVGVTVLNLLLIPKFGGYGAAWATVGAFFIRFILVHFFSQKFYYVDYGWSRQGGLLAAAVLVFAAGKMLETSVWQLSVCVNTLLAACFGLIIYIFVLDKPEKSFIQRLLVNPVSLVKGFTAMRP